MLLEANHRRLPYDDDDGEPDWDAIEEAEIQAGHQRRDPFLPPWVPYAPGEVTSRG